MKQNNLLGNEKQFLSIADIAKILSISKRQAAYLFEKRCDRLLDVGLYLKKRVVSRTAFLQWCQKNNINPTV